MILMLWIGIVWEILMVRGNRRTRVGVIVVGVSF